MRGEGKSVATSFMLVIVEQDKQIRRGHPLSSRIFLQLNKEMFDLKIKEFNIRNDAIQWQISTSAKVITMHFALSFHRFRDINI